MKNLKSKNKRFYPKDNNTSKDYINGIVRSKGKGFILSPTSKKNRHNYIITGNLKELEDGDLIEAEIIRKRHRNDPKHICKFSKILKKSILQNGKSLGQIALEEYNIPIEFSEETLKEVTKKRPIKMDKRLDLENMPFVTIDPETARDHDDAVAAQYDNSTSNPDGFIVYVAIADVSHYVTVNSLTDIEAKKRGNSIYLPDVMIPMLPEYLATNLCSLKENLRRPVLCVKITFDKYGNKVNHEFCRAVIKCFANLSYEETQRLYDGVKDPNLKNYVSIMKPLFDAYKAVRKARNKRSPLNLDLTEYEIQINDEGEVTEIYPKDKLETHKLIEEFMVMANVCVAETLEKKKSPVIYRTHDVPPDDKISVLKNTLREMNINFAKGQRMSTHVFNKILAKSKGKEFEDLVGKLILRCQCQAIYSTKNDGHYGLNLNKYAHFTSPIRRYADLLIHRALISCLNMGKDEFLSDKEELNQISDHISKTERKAMRIEMETKDRYMAKFMKKFLGDMFHAKISGMSRAGLFVKIPKYGAEGFIPMQDLSPKRNRKRYFIFDEKTNKMIDRISGDYYILGQNIRVKLLEATPLTGGMRFILIDNKDILKSRRSRE